VPARWGPDVPLTLSPGGAVEAALVLDPAVVVPVHQEGWAHFTSGPEALAQAFAEAGLSGRLRPVAPGATIDLV
jgi:L-ascorbate metabolism protein UlaG (beta-lactamase superfamily)